MTNFLKKNEERLELIEIAVKEGAKTKKEICEKTGYSPYVVNSTLKVFPRQAQEIQNEMKKATQKSSKTKGRKTSKNATKRKVTTRKDATSNQEKIAVLDISMLNVENVIEILQQYMEEGVKIAVSNTTIYQINSNSERRNETTGEKTARAKRASELMKFLQERKEELKPIWITGEASVEALLLVCKKLEGDVVIFTGSQVMDLTAWTFGIKSKYFPKEDITSSNGKPDLPKEDITSSNEKTNFQEESAMLMETPVGVIQEEDISSDFDNGLTTPIEIPTNVMQMEEFDEKQTVAIEIPKFDNYRDNIKTLPGTMLDDNGNLYLCNEFDLLQVKTYRCEEKDVRKKVKLEKGDLVFIAIGDDERLFLDYYKIIEISLRNHAKRLYKKTIYSFEPSTHTINNPNFKKFADKAAKEVFGR